MKNLSDIITSNAQIIEEAMKSYLTSAKMTYEVLLESMRYSAYAGGKRIRPFLTLECAKSLGGEVEAALPFACAIEMIHTYSLIHDDLPCMDNDDYRRGKLTNHKVFGEANALLSGDALLTYGLEVAATNPYVDAATALEAVKLLTKNSGKDGMIGGQVIDLMGEKEKLSYDDFLLMNNLKTGCLIKAACLLGVLSTGRTSDSEEYKAFSTYAENIGLAFQIEDDLLDMGSEDNKTTFLTFMTEDEAKKKIEALTSEAIDVISKYDTNGVLSKFALYLSSRTV